MNVEEEDILFSLNGDNLRERNRVCQIIVATRSSSAWAGLWTNSIKITLRMLYEKPILSLKTDLYLCMGASVFNGRLSV